MTSGGPRSIALRLAAVLLGSVLALVGLELALRLGAAFVGPRDAAGPPVPGGATVVAVGDSYTYGVFYPAEESYPGQLEAMLGRRSDRSVRVVNLGLPGMSSSELVDRFPGWCERYRPEVAIVCVGVNNLWNRTGRGEETHLLSGSRVVRLARLMGLRLRPARAVATPGRPSLRRVPTEGGVEYRERETGETLIRHEGFGVTPRTMDEATAILRRDLETMLRQAGWWGVRLHLLAYPVPPFPADESSVAGLRAMNREMAELARARGVAFTDPQPRFEALTTRASPIDLLFHSATDTHPNPTGYRLVAEALAEALTER